MKKNLKSVLGKQVIIGDGSMGTLLQVKINGQFVPDEMNLSRPELIEEIYRAYAKNGADIITTNTFGASPLKLREVVLEKEFKKINQQAVKMALKVAEKIPVWVAGNIGPCGRLIEPLGDLNFEEAVDNFSQQASVLEAAGADLILLETIPEIQEFRAAVIGILSAVKIPVLASMSFSQGDQSISGTSGKVFGVTSNFAGLSAVGSNCGTSLDNMKKVMEEISIYASLPLLCQPNAGIPILEKGKPAFKVTADEFVDFMEPIYKLGVSIIGSCCGSTPDFTRKLSKRFKGKPVLSRKTNQNLILSTRTEIKEVTGEKIFLVGERINPTGRSKLRQEIKTGRLTTVRYEAREQEKKGSDALDVNVNVHELELTVVGNIVKSVQNMVNIPLFIDSTDPIYVDIFGKLYAGKGVINSISGEKKSQDKLLPLAKKYNLAFVAILMDDHGIPDTAPKRVSIAKKIVKAAEKYGISRKDIIFDPLVLSAGAEISKVRVTLETLELLKREFPKNKTIMGLSNISFGLPNRELVNSTFLALAVSRGLDMVIANPFHESIQNQLLALNFLRNGSGENLAVYTDYFSGLEQKTPDQLHRGSENLYDNILEGDGDSAIENINNLLKKESPLDIINNYIMKAMEDVGKKFQNREFFLPQLMASADVVKAVLPSLKEKLPQSKEKREVKILFATVQGDIHDIGKNIVVSILESFNFNVIDLGKDVPAETIISRALEHNVDVIGLSTLMTTTIPAMLDTITLIRQNARLKSVKIFIGGAVVNRKIADSAEVFYTRDGIEMVKKIKKMNQLDKV